MARKRKQNPKPVPSNLSYSQLDDRTDLLGRLAKGVHVAARTECLDGGGPGHSARLESAVLGFGDRALDHAAIRADWQFLRAVTIFQGIRLPTASQGLDLAAVSLWSPSCFLEPHTRDGVPVRQTGVPPGRRSAAGPRFFRSRVQFSTGADDCTTGFHLSELPSAVDLSA
jgi:hypothetical protein